VPDVFRKYWGLPGTGKTSALIREIDRLIGEGYEQKDMVVTTFRRQLAYELINRVEALTDLTDSDKVHMSTIHGVCRRILGIEKEVVVNNHDKREFCQQFGVDYQETHENDTDIIDPYDTAQRSTGEILFDLYSWLINNLKEPPQWREYPGIKKLSACVIDPESTVKAFLEGWREFKDERGKYDFGDMLKTAYEEQTPIDAQVVVFDEFQDLTPIMNKLFDLWIEDADVVLIAGDKYQCIYPFWGANPDFFDEKDGELIILDTSWRLPQPIWNYAESILKNVGYDVPDIKCNGGSGEVRSISYYDYLHMIPRFKEDTFHLFRCNFMASKPSEELIYAGVPFSGWTQKQITLYNAILKLRQVIKGEEESINRELLTVILESYPASCLKVKRKTFLEQIEETGKSLFSLDDLKGIIKFTSTKGERNLISAIMSHDPIVYALKSAEAVRTAAAQEKIRRALWNWKKPITDIGDITVRVGTIHGAKGLECKNVFVSDRITRTIENDIEDMKKYKDEARVFFMACTRTKQQLFIVKSSGGCPKFIMPEVF